MRPFDHLPRNIGAARRLGRLGHQAVDLPIPLRHMGIGGGGGRVGDGRGGDDAGGIALILRHFEQRRHLERRGRGTVIFDRLRSDADHAIFGFDPGDQRGGGWRAVGDLCIVGIGFDQSGVGQAVHLRDKGFPVDALLLPFEYASGGQRADAHAVADEQDDIARLAVVGLVRLQAFQLILSRL